jgi:sulfotransferase family protein
MSENRPIFLVGCPRSGTTLLSTMLHAHPRIAMPPETRFLLPAYRNRAAYGDLRQPENRRRLAHDLVADPGRFHELQLDRDDIVEKIVAGAPTIGSAAGTIWREFARSRGKARWGEKRPAYWRDMGMVLRLFPDAQIVHLVRDGRACVASLSKVHWWQHGTVGATSSWVLADRFLRSLGRKLPPDAYYRLRYEDLLADPRGELARLCAFLGERFDDQMLDYAKAADDIVPGYKERWHGRTRQALDPGRIEAWRADLTPSEIGLVEAVAARPMRRNGYRPSGIGRPPTPAERAAYYREYARKLRTIYRERAIDAVKRRRHPQPLADQG